MAYTKHSYTIPSLSLSFTETQINSVTIYSDWTACAIPAQTGTHFAVALLNVGGLTLNKLSGWDNWSLESGLYLATAGLAPVTQFLLGQITCWYCGGAGTANMSTARSITSAVTQCRLSLTLTKGNCSYGATGSVTLGGGTIDVYTESTTGEMKKFPFDKNDGLPAYVGLSGGNLLKYRYRGQQTESGVGMWGYTPVSNENRFISFGS